MGTTQFKEEEVEVTTELLRQLIRFNNTSLKTIDSLVKRGADINTEHGVILSRSVQYGTSKLVEYFIKHGADVNADDSFALEICLEENKNNMAKLLMSHGAIASPIFSKNNQKKYIALFKELELEKVNHINETLGTGQKEWLYAPSRRKKTI